MADGIGSIGVSGRLIEWLESNRGLPAELAVEMGVSEHQGRIVFEYRRGGELIWVQHRIAQRDGSKTFRCYAPDHKTTLKAAGLALSFWNEDELCDPSTPEVARIITEGQFDAVAVKAAGFGFVGSVPNGAVDREIDHTQAIDVAKDNQFQFLWEGPDARGRYRPRGGLAQAKKIILCTDGDRAGLVLRDELADRLGRGRCWYVTYPADVVPELGRPCKDANEVLKHFGRERLAAMIEGADPLVPSRLVAFSKIPQRAAQDRLSSGWTGLDDHFRIIAPQLIVVTGKPNAGKSTWVLALVSNLARLYGLKCALLQFEDNPERNRTDLLRYAQVWTNNGKAGIYGQTPEEWVDRLFVTIAPSDAIDDEDDFDLPWLKQAIEEAVLRHGCSIVVIDPWNEVEHMWSRQDTEATYLNRAVRQLKRLSRRYGIVLIIVTHPTKAGGQIADVEDVSLNEISGGATWNNKADLGVIVWADDVSVSRRRIKVAKSKDFLRMGRPGIVEMEFNQDSKIYTVVA